MGPARSPLQHHARALLIVHIVWTTQKRAPLLDTNMDAWLHGKLVRKARELDCQILAFGNADDHVHVLARYPSTVTLAGLLQRLKGATSHAWNATSPVTGLSWQPGYWAESVDPANLPPLVRYIRAQREHHRDRSAAEPWETPDTAATTT